MSQAAPTPLRIAVLARVFDASNGGAERYAVTLAEQLAQRHHITVFAQRSAALPPGLRFHRVPGAGVRPRWVNQVWFALATAWLTRGGYDVIHSHENTWRGEVQTVHVRSIRSALFPPGMAPVRRILRWTQVLTSLRLATYVALDAARLRPRSGRVIVVVSDTLRAELQRLDPRLAGHMVRLPPGVVRVARDSRASQDLRQQQRERLGLGAQVPLLLFVANDFQKKGLGVLLEALLPLPAVHLAVIGEGAGKDEAHRQVARTGMRDRVHFLGRLAHLSPWYLAADVMVHPTTEDTFGMAALEAMAHGLPLVLSRAPWCGLAAELAPGDAILLDDPANPQALTAVLQPLIADPARREALGSAAFAAAARFDWTELARRQEAIYRQAVAGWPGAETASP